MSLETAALDHACQVVRRQVQDEIRDLTLFFIVHGPGERVAALEDRKAELFEHVAGEALYTSLKLCAQFKPDNSMLVGFTSATEETFFSFMARQKTIVAFYMNTNDYKNENEMRQGIYHLTWHALSLIDHHKNDEKEFFVVNEGSIRPAYNLINLARENMLADAFSAIMMELQGHKNFIHNLAKKRCEMALQPIVGYRAEQFPYPIAADAAQIVYGELMDGISNKTKLTQQAIDITREIGFTYDDNSIRQWMVFSMAAQEMAWMNLDKNKILGTAIYTSEDPYVRSTAYIVAETLNMEPAALTDLGQYNPFTDQEVNERLHNRLCDDAFQAMLAKTARIEDASLFRDRAKTQNAKLIDGHITGWCAHALLAAHDAFAKAFDNNERPAEQAMIAYQNARRSLAWESMFKLSHIIMNKKRQGLEITPSLITDLCRDHKIFSPIASALEWAEPRTKTKKTDEMQKSKEKPEKEPDQATPLTFEDDDHSF